LERVLTDFGSEHSFRHAAARVLEHYGFEINASAVRNATLQHAAKAEQMLQKEYEQPFRVLPAVGAQQVVAEADGSMICTVAPGPRQGKRPRDYKEIRLTVAQASGSTEKFYAATFGEVDEVGRRWGHCARRAGWGLNSQIHALGDGAEWVWNLKKDRWKDALELLDFYHGSEHLWNLGRLLHGEKEPALSHWAKPLRHQIRHGQEKQALRQIAQIQKRRGEEGKVIGREQNYFKTHAGRMNYQQIAKRGWPIGSGAVESACRQKQCRFKRGGQFWTKESLRNLCALDEARRNRHWDELWSPN